MNSSIRTQLLPCEVLFDLFDGPSGTASIGRLLAGTDAGRQVFLRRTPNQSANELAQEVAAARLVAHPSIIKVLGLATLDGVIHVASEYIMGASLLQVSTATKAQQDVMEAKVGLKIIHDALRASASARQLLKQTSNWWVPRTIFSDTVWVAEYGETLLTEVGVSRLLHGPERRSGPPADSSKQEADADVAAAGAELRRLLTNQRGELMVPRPFENLVASIIARAENPGEPNRFQDSEEMAHALEELPPGCIATEGEVGFAIRSLMGPVLQRQRTKLGVCEAETADRVSEDATRVFNASQLVRETERITARPPAMPAPERKGQTTAGEPPFVVDEKYDATQMMFVEPGGLGADRDDEMTQIFMPVFEGEGPKREARTGTSPRIGAAPIDSIPMLPNLESLRDPNLMLARQPMRREARGRAPRDWWKATALVLAVLLALVVSLVVLR